MLKIAADQLRPLPQFKVGEIETGRDCATRQRERSGISNVGSEPVARLDCCLQHITSLGIAAQMDCRVVAVRLDHMYGYLPAGIKVP